MKRPTQPRIIILLLLLISSPLLLCAGQASELRQGLSEYKKGNLEAAFLKFASASTNETSDSAIARFNAGTTAMKLGVPELSTDLLQAAMQASDNLDLTRDAAHNLGNAFFQQANTLEGSNDLEQAVTNMDKALESYRNAILLDPSTRDSKAMYELGLHNRERLQSLMQKQSEEDQKKSDEEDEGDKNDDEKEEGDKSDDPQDEEDKDDESSDPDEQKSDDPSDEEEKQDEDSKPSDEEKGDEEEQDGKKDGDEKGDESSEDQPPEESSGEPKDPQEQAMNEDQVERMLQALRSEEQAARDNRPLRFGSPVRVEKNW